MFKKKITLSFTITEFHFLILIVIGIHYTIFQTNVRISPPVQSQVKKESKVSKIPVSFKSRISRKTRTSRFNRYIKGLKDHKINQEVMNDKDLPSGLDQEQDKDLKDLTNEQIARILEEQDKQLAMDVLNAKKIFQKSQKSYQVCYESALLKDKFLNGVSNLVVSIDSGSIKEVQTNFKGDGHKTALIVLNDCLKTKSKNLNVSSIKGEHLINFNLIFKS